MALIDLFDGVDVQQHGEEMYALATTLYPICRSITGNGGGSRGKQPPAAMARREASRGTAPPGQADQAEDSRVARALQDNGLGMAGWRS